MRIFGDISQENIFLGEGGELAVRDNLAEGGFPCDV